MNLPGQAVIGVVASADAVGTSHAATYGEI
jgi:hypothetical protein